MTSLEQHLEAHLRRLGHARIVPSVSCSCGNWGSEVVGTNKTAVQLHAAHVAATWREERTVRTVAELEALPVGTVIRTGGEERVAVKSGYRMGNVSGYQAWWDEPGEEGSCSSDELDDLPAIVLWAPEDGAL